MSTDNQAQIIQCGGCNSKLRVGASASGKTIACPKCGQQIRVEDHSRPAKSLVVARPVSGPVTHAQAPSAGPFLPSVDRGNNWDNLQVPAPSVAYQPFSAKPKAVRKNQLWLWIALGGAAAVLLLGVTVTVLVVAFSKGKPTASLPGPSPSKRLSPSVPRPSSDNRAPMTRNAIMFPELGPGMPFGKEIVFHRVAIPRRQQRPLTLNIFIPKGEHASQSLPVMFESPSGTNLLHGAEVDFPRPATEILPFTEAGMITVTFSIDGAMPRSLSPTAGPVYFRQLERSYKDFVDAEAGVASGKLAIDYVLDQLTAADPKRLYIWGHSSSATLSLLMASKDARLSKCIALAPITDLNERLGELLTDSSMQKSLPNLREYFKSGSPLNLVNDLKCPVFLAHAHDDDNEPFKNTQAYVRSLRQAGGNVTFEELSSGGHYQELLEASIPKAVQWLK